MAKPQKSFRSERSIGDALIAWSLILVPVLLVGLAWGVTAGGLLLLAIAGMKVVFAGQRQQALEDRVREGAEKEQRLQKHAASLQERQEELERGRSAAELNSRVMTEFLANMSHEIRTPVNGIIGMANLLMETDLTQEQRDYTRTMHSSARGLLTMLDGILDFSRMEADTLELDRSEFPLRRCLEEMVELLFPPAHAKGIELTCVIQPSVPDRLIGDRTRLRQILTNLVGNAIKFTQEGRIELDVSSRDSGDPDQALIEFRVRDTGVGIPEERREDLLHPFTRLESSPEERQGGTGLGLAISNRLAEMMNGSLGFESELGVGSTFWARIPFERAGEVEYDPHGVELLRGKRALVVAQSATERRVIRIYAHHLGLEVVDAEGSDDAMERLHEALRCGRPFDVALLDRDLQRMDGKEFAARIKSDLALRRTRLILVNRLGRAAEATSMARAGLDAWITKPVSSRKLRMALIHVLDALIGEGREFNAPEPAPRPHEKGEPERRIRVLVAEDNAVNQRIVRMMLSKLGCETHIARDGRQAVDMARAEHFDIVFMDCQMPVISGFEATQAVRELTDTDRRTVPIVAMTADASGGDRERCLTMGMDDCISKPVQAVDLRRMLSKWVERDIQPIGPGGTERSTTMSDETDGVLDREAIQALRDLSGEDDPGLFVELVHLFLEDTPSRMADLTAAFRSADSDAMERTAHALKSSAANLGAAKLAQLFREIESAGRERDLQRAESLISESKQEYERVESALQSEIE